MTAMTGALRKWIRRMDLFLLFLTAERPGPLQITISPSRRIRPQAGNTESGFDSQKRLLAVSGKEPFHF